MFCGDQSLVKRSDSAIHVKPLPCKRWSCPVCAPLKQARLEMMIEAGQPNAMMTFTLLRRPGASPEAARKQLSKNMAEFMRRVRRKYVPGLEYFAVVETHKAYWPHAHVALKDWTFVHWKVLRALWETITGGSYQLDVQRIPAGKAKKYLAKYFSKEPVQFGQSKRYWRSRGYLPKGWGEPTDEEAEQWQGWRKEDEHPREVIDKLRFAGWYEHSIGKNEAVLTPPPWFIPPPTGSPALRAAR